MDLQPPLPPALLPFTIRQGDAQLVVTLQRDASHHYGLGELRAIAWVRGVDQPLVVDLAQITLLSSALIGWMFGLIHEGKLGSLAIRHAHRRVQAQIQQVGLARFVSYQADELALAPAPLGA